MAVKRDDRKNYVIYQRERELLDTLKAKTDRSRSYLVRRGIRLLARSQGIKVPKGTEGVAEK